MSYILEGARMARRWGWLLAFPVLAVCSAANTDAPVAEKPTAVSDLTVGATTDVTATLSFTQVDDGMGQPAKYDVRFATAPISWSSAASITSGTCTTPVAGSVIGSTLTCTVFGLLPSTSYNFQVMPFRGTLNNGAVFGPASNVAAASTATSTVLPVVTSVAISPASASVVAGATVNLQATVNDQNGNGMAGQAVAWSTSNSAAATVNSNGVVTGVAAGSATITATSSGKAGTATITVTAAPAVVATVTVAPTSASVVAGATVNLQATVKDQYGNAMTGQSVTWSTSNAAAATVNSSGVVTGVAAGSATITAASSGKSGTAAVTVTAPASVVTTVSVAPGAASVVVGATVSLQVTVKDQNGNVMTGQTITWSTSNPASATVNASGVVSGVAAGSATITAMSSGKSGTAAITVTAPSSGATLLFSEDFENASIGSRGWYDNTNVLLSTAEHVTGSTASAQYRFLAGASGPTSGGAQRHKFAATSTLYISYYVKYSTNYVGSGQSYHPHEFYAMSTLDGDYDGPSQNYLTVYLEQNYQNGGRPRMALQDNLSINTTLGSLPRNLIGVTENRSTGGCNGVAESNIVSECFNDLGFWYNDKVLTGPVMFQPTAGAGYKNNWNFVEAYYQLNTVVNGIGQSDGVMQYWFNGTLVIDRHDIQFRTGQHPTIQFNQFLIAPYIGDGSPVDQSMFIDNLRVGTGRLP